MRCDGSRLNLITLVGQLPAISSVPLRFYLLQVLHCLPLEFKSLSVVSGRSQWLPRVLCVWVNGEASILETICLPNILAISRKSPSLNQVSQERGLCVHTSHGCLGHNAISKPLTPLTLGHCLLDWLVGKILNAFLFYTHTEFISIPCFACTLF